MSPMYKSDVKLNAHHILQKYTQQSANNHYRIVCSVDEKTLISNCKTISPSPLNRNAGYSECCDIDYNLKVLILLIKGSVIVVCCDVQYSYSIAKKIKIQKYLYIVVKVHMLRFLENFVGNQLLHIDQSHFRIKRGPPTVDVILTSSSSYINT